MKAMKTILCAAIILGLCLSLAACSSGSSGTAVLPAWMATAPAGVPALTSDHSLETEAPAEDEGGKGSAPRLAGASVGDVIQFGSFEQDNDTSNGSEPIDWKVLAKDGNRIFVISVYGLDCRPFDEENVAHGWKDCSLRRWLNGEFLNVAFTPEERDAIPTVEIPAGENSYYGTRDDFSGSTRDRVFCLSEAELHEYLDTDGNHHNDDRGYYCVSTLYAEANGAVTYPRDLPENIAHLAGQCGYWLRSPSRDDKCAMICTMGLPSFLGLDYNLHDTAVRPAMWIITGG